MCVKLKCPRKGAHFLRLVLSPSLQIISDSQCRNVSILASYLPVPDALRLSFRQEGSTFTWVVVSCVVLDQDRDDRVRCEGAVNSRRKQRKPSWTRTCSVLPATRASDAGDSKKRPSKK
jgi:hypothetical protein